MTLAELLDGYARVEPPGPLITGISVDSRLTQHGDLFVALAGRSRHGLEFVAEAHQRGCAAVIWEPDAAAPAALLERLDCPAWPIPLLARNVGEIASRFYRHPSAELTVIGVTGTNGKSSYVEFLGHSLSAAGHRCGTIGTLGSGLIGQRRPGALTTPDAPAMHRELAGMRDAGAEYVAVEVSSHALDQGRAGGVRFAGAAFTNLTRDHLDYHGTMEAYLAAKARLFAAEGLGFAILNADDPHTESLREVIPEHARILSYGIQSGAIRGTAVRTGGDGLRFNLEVAGERLPVASPLIGRFNVYNLLAVAATLIALGWRPTEVACALTGVTAPPGRMNVLGGRGQPLVVIDYAHTPDALEQALKAVREHCLGELICVFGCGGERDAGKRERMGAVADALADRVIVTDDNPRGEDGGAIAQAIVSGMKRPPAVIRDRAQAIFEAVRAAAASDLVLVAGKGHETHQEVAGVKRPFDDREVAAEALEGRG